MTNPFELAEKTMCDAWYKDNQRRAIVAIVPGSIDWTNGECSIRYILAEMTSGAGITSRRDFEYVRNNLEALEKPEGAERIGIGKLRELTQSAFHGKSS